MDEITLLKAWSRLETLHKNLPSGKIKETYVADYHNILKTLEQETGQSLDEFRIPDSQLQRHVTSFSEPSIFNDYDESVTYSDSRYCERAFFLMRLEAAMNFFRYLMPPETKRRIGF